MDLRAILCDIVNRCVAEVNDGDDIKGPIKEKILSGNIARLYGIDIEAKKKEIGILNAKGSLYLTRPSLGAYTATRKDLEACAKSLFKMVKSGKVKIAIDQRYPLAEAAQAHIDLESRKTTGQTILVP